MNRYKFGFRFNCLSLLFSFALVLLAASAVFAQIAPSPYVGKISPGLLNKLAAAKWKSQRVYNRADMLNAADAQPLGASKAAIAANSIAVASSTQTIDFLTDLGPSATAPTNSPTNIDPTYSPSENFIVFSSNGVLKTSGSSPTFTTGTTNHIFAMLAGDSAGLNASGASVPPASLQQITNGKTSTGVAENERWPWVISDTEIVFCQQQSDGNYHVILGTISNNSGVLSVTGQSDITATAGPGTFLDCEHPSFSGGFIIYAGRTNSSSPYHLYLYDLADKSTSQLTTGTSDEENPSFSPLGGLIAFDSNATGFTATHTLPALSGTAGSGVRNIFVMNASGTLVTQFSHAGSGVVNSIEPAWADVPPSTPTRGDGSNTPILPQGQKIFFSSNRTNGHYNIWWVEADVINNSNTTPVTFEGEVINSVANTAVEVKTSDPPTVNGVAVAPVGASDNFEPSVSAFNFYYTVLYSSPRFVQNLPTDNPLANTPNPAFNSTGLDKEPGNFPTNPLGTFTPPDTELNPSGGFEVLGSKLLDIDPPTLLSYSPSEIVHVQSDLPQQTLNPATHFVSAGNTIHFLVRLSQRQSGVGQAYLQIKDPNSKYQDAAGLEHKVFTESTEAFGPYVPGTGGAAATGQGPQLHSQANEATTLFGVGGSSGGSGGIAIGGFDTIDAAKDPDMLGHIITTNPISPPAVSTPSTYPTPGGVAGQSRMSAIQTPPVTTMTLQDVQDLADSGGPNHLAGDIIQLYNYLGNPIEQVQIIASNYNLAGAAPISGTFVVTPVENQYVIPPGATAPAPGYAVVVATSRMDFMGNEVDCQAIEAGNGAQVDASQPSNFSIPRYTPGVDDAPVQSGNGIGPTQTGYNQFALNAVPAGDIWLPLTPVASTLGGSPNPLYDNAGGVLYEATWTTPNLPSDYYVDLIAYDNEVNPSNANSPAQNWRIYDNIWGFTTKVFQSHTSPGGILVVNDYDLPQKFFSGRFGNIVPNNVPINYYGAESYLTDVDVNYNDPIYNGGHPTAWLPDSAMNTDEDTTLTGVANFLNGRMTQLFHLPAGGANNPFAGPQYTPFYPNTLGVDSYVDADQDNVNVNADNIPAHPLRHTDVTGSDNGLLNYNNAPEEAPSQIYDIWRVLCRGPIPSTVLNAYAPQVNNQPLDPINGNAIKAVLVAPSCVIWSSPFAGDEFVGSGTITDPNVQAQLTAYVQAGGRLMVEGIDVGYALTGNGNIKNPFYDNILGAQFGSDGQTMNDNVVVLAAAIGQTHYLSNDSFINAAPASAAGAQPTNYPSQTGDVAHINFKFDRASGQFGVIPNWDYGAPEAGRLGLALENRSTANSLDTRTDASSNDGGSSARALSNAGYIDTFTPDGTLAGSAGPVIGNFQSIEMHGVGTPTDQMMYTTFASPKGVDYGAGITVYSSFGIESLSQELNTIQQTDPSMQAGGKEYDTFSVLAQRTDTMQNIICFLRTGTLTGVVTNTTGGQTVNRATVVATWVGAPNGSINNPNNAISFTAQTNINGVYSIPGVPAGRYNLAAYFPGTTFQHPANSFVDVLGGDIGTLALQISPAAAGSLQVVVEDSITKNPISGAEVDAVEATGAGSDLGTEATDPTGTVNYTNVPAGSYNVTVTDPPTYGQATQLAKVTPGTQTTITILLSAAPGSLIGQVTENNAPFTGGATITVTPVASTGSTPAPVTTDGNGNYSFPSLVPGQYTVNMTASGFSPESATVTINTNAQTRQDFALNTTPVITGTVTNASNGNPISGATITISPAAGQSSVTTASDGTYTITGVTQQSYTLTATATGFNSANQTVTPVALGATTVNFSLNASVQTGFTTGLALISLPYSYPAGFTLAQTLGYNNPVLALWDPLNLKYAVTDYKLNPVGPPTTMAPGIGYWVRFTQVPVVSAGSNVASPATVQLQIGWNQIGDPFDANIALSSLTFGQPGSSSGVPYATAVTNGMINGTLFRYNTSTGQYVALSSSDSIQPFQGYWIQAFQPSPLTFTLP